MNKHWQLSFLEVRTKDGPAGYLKIGNLPPEEVAAYFPTVIHYMVRHLSHYPDLRELMNKEEKDWGKEDYKLALTKTYPQKWSISEEDIIKKLPADISELKSEWESRKDHVSAHHQQGFDQIYDRINVPYIDYIRVYNGSFSSVYENGKNIDQANTLDFRRQGIGNTLYQTGAELLAKQGLHIHASGIQSPEAEAIWKKMEEKGWVKTNLEADRRYLDPSTWT